MSYLTSEMLVAIDIIEGRVNDPDGYDENHVVVMPATVDTTKLLSAFMVIAADLVEIAATYRDQSPTEFLEAMREALAEDEPT